MPRADGVAGAGDTRGYRLTVDPPDDAVLETDRLILRKLTIDDLDDLASIYADPEVRRFFPDGTRSRDETREELDWIVDVYYRRYGYGLWATVLRETGAFVGRCGLLPWAVVPGRHGGPALEEAPEDPGDAADIEVEVAYLLARDHWGRGLGSEAARAIVAYGFEHLPVPRLICLVDPGNEASLRVAGMAGFRRDGTVELDGEVSTLLTIDRLA
jgi:ribosomal-protein-alanine N-acetyltransferase